MVLSAFTSIWLILLDILFMGSPWCQTVRYMGGCFGQELDTPDEFKRFDFASRFFPQKATIPIFKKPLRAKRGNDVTAINR